MEGEVLRDDQWERLREFVPGGRKGKRGPRSDGRRFLDALLWLARSGGRWRDLPERFGPYQTAKRPILPLWTALPLQAALKRSAWISCKHLSGVSWFPRAPKWGIRTRAPLQLVGLTGLDNSQVRRASARSVQSISPSTRKLVPIFRRRRGSDRPFEARPRLSVRSCWRWQPSRG